MENNEKILTEILEEEVTSESNKTEVVEIGEDKYVMETENEEIIKEGNSLDTVLFDAENEVNESSEESNMEDGKEILYDAEEEIKKKEFENRDVDVDDAVKIMEENPNINPDEYKIPEEQKNVFDNGLQNGQFIPRHRCPMCMFGKKSITELHVRKRFSIRKKRVIGYMSVCANCGHVDFYTDKPLDLLKYLSGKIKY